MYKSQIIFSQITVPFIPGRLLMRCFYRPIKEHGIQAGEYLTPCTVITLVTFYATQGQINIYLDY